MQFLASVGNAFLHLIGATPLSKCTAPQFPFLTFYQTGCCVIMWDIHYPNDWFCNDFFSFHTCDQRKEAKERRLIRTDILRCYNFEGYLLMKYSSAIFATPILKYLLPLETTSIAFLKPSASLPISR
jgi:hypothetical protein